MRGKTAHDVWVVPRGAYMLTLKACGVLIEGSIEELREELYLTRRAIQYVIDVLWELGKLPSINQLHQTFYKLLRNQCFRAHQAKQIYKYARAIVKSAKENSGRKPVLKKLSVRLDKYDAVVDLENQIVIAKLRGRVFKIKLLHNKDYIRKFMERKWYEVTVSIDKQGRIWVCIPFRWEYRSFKPRRLISIDINLRNVVVYNGRCARRIDARFVEALSLKIHAERLQKKYPRMWRYSQRILGRIRSLHRRSRNIVVDWSRKFAKYIVLKAMRARSVIVLEDLEKLWFNTSQKSSKLADKLSRFAYRKLQHAITTKAVEYNVPVIFINPKGTSTVCPRCRAKLSYKHRLAICNRCGLIADRDAIGAMNIYLRVLRRMQGSQGSPPSAPAMNHETRGSGRTKYEPMTIYIKTYTNIHIKR
ncbi:MAG: transposase [Thermoprotei archaeon]|nr:MAG: transposase [Thermoprotei archaeon]